MRSAARAMLLVSAVLLLELLLMLAIAHLGFRAFREFTSWGQAEVERGWVFSPGLCFGLMGWLGLRSAGLSLGAVGWSAREFWPQIGHAFRLIGSILPKALTTRSWFGIPVAIGILAYLWAWATDSLARWRVIDGGAAVLLFVSWFAAQWKHEDRQLVLAPRISSLVLFALVAVWFLVIPTSRAIPEMIWIVAFSAIGEELFFRGYIQSRCNQLFGRPWKIGKTSVGPGLIIAAVLFGAVHVVNPWNYFTAQGELAWIAGLASALSLYLGVTYERTGSLIAPVALHAMGNLLIRIGRELAA